MTIPTIQDVAAITEAKPVPVGAADEFTRALKGATGAQTYSGAVSLVEKDKLVNIPLLIMGYRIHTAESGAKGGDDARYAFVRAMLPNAAEVGFTDGGSAIMPVLESHAGADQSSNVDGDEVIFHSPLYCPRGLRRSDYDGQYGAATTYWIA